MDYNPSFFFHTTGKKCLVRDAVEEAALGPDWFDSPKKAAAARAAAEAVPPKKSKE